MGNTEPMNTNSVHNLIDSQILAQLRKLNKPSKTYWPHQIILTSWRDVNPAERFCYDNFKSSNWRNIGGDFYFKRKEDYEWFVLRWT